MANRIDTVEGRSKLKVRPSPYWHKLSNACALGFRKMTQQSEGTWLAQFYDSSTKSQLRKSLGSFSHLQASLRFDEAKKAAEALFDHLRQGGSREVISVRDACERYCQALQDKGAVKNSKDTQDRFKRWIYAHKIANIHLTKLSKRQVEDWRNQLAKTEVVINPHSKNPSTRPRAASSLNRDMAALKAALNDAKNNGWVTSDMAWKHPLKPVANATGKRQVYLDKSEREKLIAHAQKDVGLYLRGLSLLPLRPGALASLTVGDLDIKNRSLLISIDKTGGKRKIILPSQTLEFLQTLVKDKLPTAKIFTRADGIEWNKDSWKNPIKSAAMSAGLPIATTAYTLRHSVITDLVTNGLDLLSTAQLSGTSVLMIEKHYGHFRAEHAANALAQLA